MTLFNIYILFLILFIKYCLFLASPYGKCKRRQWNETEKEIVLDVFGSYIPQKQLPSLCEIQELIKKNPTGLKRRTAAMIKAWLMNQRQKQRSSKP